MLGRKKIIEHPLNLIGMTTTLFSHHLMSPLQFKAEVHGCCGEDHLATALL